MKIPLERPQVITLAALFIVIIVLAVAFFLGGREESIPLSSSTLKEVVAPLPVPSSSEKRTVVLFFASEEDGLLHPEERVIEAGPTPSREAGRILEELIQGSRSGFLSTLPPETKVRQVYLTKEGIAYADFSKELSVRHPSGSTAEMSTVYAVVNSLAYNFKDIKRVLILIEGTEKETLNGHVRLDLPLEPNFSLAVQVP